MKRTILLSSIVLAVASLGLSGCNSPSSSVEPTSSETGDAGQVQHEHGDHMHHEEHSAAEMEKMKAGLAELSPEDAASAEKQHVCPVSGEMLGTMGAPKKVDVNGQQVWICCDGCKDTLLANPEEYLAKLQDE